MIGTIHDWYIINNCITTIGLNLVSSEQQLEKFNILCFWLAKLRGRRCLALLESDGEDVFTSFQDIMTQ